MEAVRPSNHEHGAPAGTGAATADTLSEEHAWRARVYGLLAALLAAPPSARLLESLCAIDDSADAGVMAPAWRSLRRAAGAARVEAVDDEYHALFIGVGRGELMPYGSWYLTGFLMERPLAVLRGALRSLGIERQSGVGEPEDHATALCETMRMIIESADDIDFATQRAFFNDHLAPWMGQFFLDMRTAESACFYRAVGQFGEQFIKLEQHYFSMMA